MTTQDNQKNILVLFSTSIPGYIPLTPIIFTDLKQLSCLSHPILKNCSFFIAIVPFDN